MDADVNATRREKGGEKEEKGEKKKNEYSINST